MEIKTFEIRVRGIVQGVGFRPFIYKLAHETNLKGTVLNDTEGVLIRINCSREIAAGFAETIKKKSPSLSKIVKIELKEIEWEEFSGFKVVESNLTKVKNTFIPPDTAVCEDCLKELFDPGDRRYHFPFINCTNCGPRFSIIYDIPYDRKFTAMNDFPMCNDCRREYEDPKNRRFHTEPTSCPECGPAFFLKDKNGKILSSDIEVILDSIPGFIKEGKIVAIKGIGGFHLAVDAKNDKAVKLLRDRKQRPFKPFALMVNDINKASEFLDVSKAEEKLLLSKERPIVILKEKKKIVSPDVAGGLSHLGLMLPYSPFQFLLFSKDKEMVLIMTSGNVSDEPIVYEEEILFKKLGNIADYFVTSNRKIVEQSDDSVMFVENERPFYIRRSKGFVPIPAFSKKAKKNIFASGSDIKNSFALAKDNLVFLSQYIGDLESPLTERVYKKSIDHFKNIFDINPEIIVSDKHPNYFSTQIANELSKNGAKRVSVQHHHAHIAAVLEENNLDEKVIGIAFDGTGYGTDGKIWGGEFLIADREDFKRGAHFSYFKLPGGEAAIKEVWRIGLSLLHETFGKDIYEGSPERKIIVELLEKKINSPECCSVGRIFDGVSSLLGMSEVISTEAEAAQLLEEAAMKHKEKRSFPVGILKNEKNSPYIVDVKGIIKNIIELKEKGVPAEDIAYAFHHSLMKVTVKIAKQLRENFNINKVALNGGVFQNRLFLRLILKELKENNFEILLPKEFPFNDGGIALGQITVTKKRLGL
ncbi:MAG: carbamoyltransferase HypF [Acidobacteriota bacterium]